MPRSNFFPLHPVVPVTKKNYSIWKFHSSLLLNSDDPFTLLLNKNILLLLLLLLLLQFSCHSVAAVLTPVQTEQIRINIHKRNNTRNTVQTVQNTVNTSTHINKTTTNYKTHTYSHTHITKTHTYTHISTNYKTS